MGGSIARIASIKSTMASEQNNFAMRGVLEGHSGWVTSIATTNENPEMILSASRDKTVMVWQITGEDMKYGAPKKALRVWDLNTGLTTRRFVGHSKDVLSVAFSADNRQIVSGSRDKTIKLWNTLGECKYTIVSEGEGHSEWVSCVSFSPSTAAPLIVSGGWDKLVKVWNLTNCKLRTNLIGHSGYINAVTVSPDGSLCASGGKDGVAMLWDLNEGKRLYSLPCEQGDIIHALCFSPNRYWLCAGTDNGIRIWDLEGKGIVDELKLDLPARDPKSKALPTSCISLAWSADGNTLFAGYTDNMIRAWQVTAGQNTIF